MVSYTLDQVVREHMIALGQSNENKYARYLQMGINGLREFNMDMNPDQGAPAAVLLPVNANQTVSLPADYTDYIRIGILDECGNFVALGYNKNLRYSNPLDSCGNPILVPANLPTQSQSNGANPEFWAFWNWEGIADNVRNNELVGRFFGLGGGNNPNGYYRVNLRSGQIELGAVCQHTIMLEYLADLSLVNGEYTVHPYMVSALKRFIKYEDIFENDKIADVTKERARMEKFNEWRRAKQRFNVPRLNEIQAEFRKMNMAAVRW